jgi:hypothetical protein
VSFRYKIISSASRNNMTSSFPTGIPFIYFSCLTALDRKSSTVLNKGEHIGYPYFVPDFRGNGLICSLLSMILAMGLSYVWLHVIYMYVYMYIYNIYIYTYRHIYNI